MNGMYTLFAANYDDAVRAAAQSAMTAGLSRIREWLPFIFFIMVSIAAIGVISGALIMQRVLVYGFRAAVVMWLVVSMAYIPMVWTLVADTIPTEIASAINGGGSRVTAISQFDEVNRVASTHIADILAQATSLWQVGDRMAAYVASGCQKVVLTFIFAIYFSMRLMGYVLVAGGVWLLPGLLFDGTRGWVQEFFGKIVGLMVWQIMTSIVVHVLLTGMLTFLATAAVVGASLTQAIDTAFMIVGWFVLCLILVILVPAVSAIGSHIGASSAVVQGALVGGAASAARLATSGGSAVSRGGRNLYNRVRRT